MILAGDIGGTNARLAYFQPTEWQSPLDFRACISPAASIAELGEIVYSFSTQSEYPARRCLLWNSRTGAQRQG
jgi:glucokinase